MIYSLESYKYQFISEPNDLYQPINLLVSLIYLNQTINYFKFLVYFYFLIIINSHYKSTFLEFTFYKLSLSISKTFKQFTLLHIIVIDLRYHMSGYLNRGNQLYHKLNHTTLELFQNLNAYLIYRELILVHFLTAQ